MRWTVSGSESVFVEVLRNGEAQEKRQANYKLGPEVVQVAELEKP